MIHETHLLCHSRAGGNPEDVREACPREGGEWIPDEYSGMIGGKIMTTNGATTGSACPREGGGLS